jgi:hypothetical protein
MIKSGTLFLHPRSGFLPFVLSWLIRWLDPDPWVRKNFKVWGKYWHLTFAYAWEPKQSDWGLRSVEGTGIKYRTLRSFKDAPTPVNWISSGTLGVDQSVIDNYCLCNDMKGYDGVGYIFTALNRLTRGVFPAIENKHFYCWEDNAEFCECMGQEWMPYGEMAYMPVLVKKCVEKKLL